MIEAKFALFSHYFALVDSCVEQENLAAVLSIRNHSSHDNDFMLVDRDNGVATSRSKELFAH